METKLSKTRINFEYKRENDNCLLRHQFPHCYVAAERKKEIIYQRIHEDIYTN